MRLPFLLLLALLHAVSSGLAEVPLQVFPERDGTNGRAGFAGVNNGLYFLWQFVPILWVTSIGLMWDAVDENIRRLQPFFLMTRSTGASGKESLTLDYVTSFAYFTPFRAAWDKHWLVSLSGIGHLLTLAGLPALAGQMWNVSWSIEDFATVKFQVAWLRSFQAVNGVLALELVLIAVMLQNRRTGLRRDPGGIANVASIVCQSQSVLGLLQRLPSYASHKHIETYLGQLHFYLKDTSDGFAQIEVRLAADGKLPELPPDHYSPSRREAHPFILWGRANFVVTLALLIPNFIVKSAYGRSAFKPFVVKGAFTLVYATYTAVYQSIQHELAVLEPYYQLRRLDSTTNKRHTSIALNYTPRSLPWMPILALRTSAKILACASIMVLFQQISMIFFPPIWTTTYENLLRGIYAIPRVLAIPTWIVLASSIIVALSGIISWIAELLHRRKPIMPRQARTLASQMLYVCGSEDLLESMQGSSSMNEKEFKKHCDDLGSQYAFGWFRGSDGLWRIGVENIESVRYLYRYPETTAPETYDDDDD